MTGCYSKPKHNVPRPRRENQWQSEAGQASVAGRGDELAADTLREAAVDTGVLALGAPAASGEGLELPVQCLSLLAV